jgi:hypothetical protein
MPTIAYKDHDGKVVEEEHENIESGGDHWYWSSETVDGSVVAYVPRERVIRVERQSSEGGLVDPTKEQGI